MFGRPYWTAQERDQHADKKTYRPLLGGAQIRTEKTTGFETGYGSLGCFLESADPARRNGSAYALTNHHVVASYDPDGPVTDIQPLPNRTHKVFQPGFNAPQPWKGKEQIGVVWAHSGHEPGEEPGTRYFDAALIKLDTGITWKPAIAELGGIRGIATDVNADTVCAAPYEVVMRGRTSGVTVGEILCVSFFFTEQGSPVLAEIAQPTPIPAFFTDLIVRAKPDPFAPEENAPALYVGQLGDSGSVLLNSRREAVGLYHSAKGPPVGGDVPPSLRDGNPPELGDVFATPMSEVLRLFNDMAEFAGDPLTVAIAEADEIDAISERTVP
jgi:hypothetical protein